MIWQNLCLIYLVDLSIIDLWGIPNRLLLISPLFFESVLLITRHCYWSYAVNNLFFLFFFNDTTCFQAFINSFSRTASFPCFTLFSSRIILKPFYPLYSLVIYSQTKIKTSYQSIDYKIRKQPCSLFREP